MIPGGQHLFSASILIAHLLAGEEMSLDKTEFSMDLLDSLRLSMEYIIY
jgi:hypothetical protein